MYKIDPLERIFSDVKFSLERNYTGSTFVTGNSRDDYILFDNETASEPYPCIRARGWSFFNTDPTTSAVQTQIDYYRADHWITERIINVQGVDLVIPVHRDISQVRIKHLRDVATILRICEAPFKFEQYNLIRREDIFFGSLRRERYTNVVGALDKGQMASYLTMALVFLGNRADQPPKNMSLYTPRPIYKEYYPDYQWDASEGIDRPSTIIL